MGYFTYHEMNIIEGPVTYEEVYQKGIEVFGPESEFCYSLSENEEYACSESKWYECIEDMKELSKHFPDSVIMINGRGEENGDLWKCYFKNGLHQYTGARITFEPYDETKLIVEEEPV